MSLDEFIRTDHQTSKRHPADEASKDIGAVCNLLFAEGGGGIVKAEIRHPIERRELTRFDEYHCVDIGG